MDDRQRYQRDGILFPLAALTPAEASQYRIACSQLEASLGGRPRTVEVRQMHLHFPWARELATRPRILDAVELLLGPNLLVWSTELFAKHPGDGIAVGWHRDKDYTGFDPTLSVTAWIALTQSTRDNGCMQVVVGSHTDASATHAPSCSKADPTAVEEHDPRATDVVLRVGQMSLHDGRLLHGSAANRSSDERIGIAVRYVSPAAKPLHGRPPALLARGADDYHHFEIVPPPSGEDWQGALAGMRNSASRHLDSMLENLRLRKNRP
jgi:hypothetical protein